MMIPSLKRIAAAAVEVEPRAAGDEDVERSAMLVVQPLHEIAPSAVLVEFVEHDEAAVRELAFEDARARSSMRAIVPSGERKGKQFHM